MTLAATFEFPALSRRLPKPARRKAQTISEPLAWASRTLEKARERDCRVLVEMRCGALYAHYERSKKFRAYMVMPKSRSMVGIYDQRASAHDLAGDIRGHRP